MSTEKLNNPKQRTMNYWQEYYTFFVLFDV